MLFYLSLFRAMLQFQITRLPDLIEKIPPPAFAEYTVLYTQNHFFLLLLQPKPLKLMGMGLFPALCPAG